MSFGIGIGIGMQFGAAGGGAIWTPADDASTLRWYDASDETTITDAGGGAVSALADKAGSDDLAQATAAARFTTGVRTINGLNVLDGDGGDHLELAGVSLPATFHEHMVLLADTTALAVDGVWSYDAANDYQIISGSTGFAPGIQAANLGIAGGQLFWGLGDFGGSVCIVSIAWDAVAGTVTVYKDGVQANQDAGYNGNMSSTMTFRIFRNRGDTVSINGAFGEYTCSSDLSTFDDHIAYLKSKWGIA